MQVTLGGRSMSIERRNAVIEAIAYIALAGIYTLDVITPPDLSLEVAYEVPVAITGITGSRKLFVRMALAAAFFNVAGFICDGFLSSFDDAIGIQNRIISLASLTLVCTLMLIVQRATAHNTALEEQRKKLLFERTLAAETERRHAELLARQEVIDELVEAIAHDVRTPLAALSLTLKQALRGQYGELPDDYREVATESRTSIDDIARLADSLLAVARFESGAALAPPVAVSVARVTSDLAHEFSSLAATRSISIGSTVSEESVVAATEPELRRALGNLVANAIRHTPPGGSIAIGTRPTQLGWAIEITDDGVGVSENSVPTLFARYAHGGGGTGLGLHIVKRIAESFGGTASYEPRRPSGSCFSLDIPVWQT